MTAMKMNELIDYDAKERQKALNVGLSFIVQAPAGSGKTELLIQRFLSLLNHVNTPEEILAITFTKKAANEMRSRVIKSLKQALTEPEPDSAHAQQTWRLAKQVLTRDQELHWNLIDNPNQLRIQTIDSLCTLLTKQLPLLSHFGSQPDIADNPDYIYREAVEEVLTHVEQHVEWAPSLSQLLLHLDNDLNKLHGLLVNLLAKRDQWLPYIHFDMNDHEIKKQLERHLSLVVAESLTRLAEIFPKNLVPELLAIARFAANNLALSSNDASEVLHCQDLQRLPSTKAADKEQWLGLARLLLTKSFTWRKKVDEDIGFPALSKLKNLIEKNTHTEYRQRLNHLINELSQREDVRLALSELFFLPEPFYQDAQWQILKALLHVLKIVAAQLRLSFQAHGQIDFIENAQAALMALGNDEHPTDLALALDYKIQHILVDEFQDTSFTQYQLLEKLTAGWEEKDGRSLFVVGDPMQSIYRFREAEVGLFIRMCKNGIGNIKLRPLRLAVNFRSTPKIIDWNNVHFKKIFPAFNDMASGAVTYSESASTNTGNKEAASSVIMHGFMDADEKKQASQVISIIKQIKLNEPSHSIAILVRSRSHLAAIMPALKKAKIDYKAVDIDPLSSKQVIQDLLSLTSALLHPADRIAWLAVLRAPWCGLSLSDLLIIAGGNAYNTIYEQLERHDVIKNLSANAKERLAKLWPILKNKIAERDRYTLRYWIENTWQLIGGPACLQDQNEMDDANAYFQLLDELHQENTSITLSRLKQKIAKLFASTQREDASLQIMTIHTAKGLEFDTVILPHLERKSPMDDKSLLTWMERPLTNDQSVLLLASINATGHDKDSIYEYIHRQKKIKSDFEIDRLFYVATTRAKKNLYLLFNAEKNSKDEIKFESSSFMEKLWPYLENKNESMLSFNSSTPALSHEENKVRPIMQLASNWQNPITSIQLKSVASHQQQTGFKTSDPKPKLIGILSHRLLQTISQMGIAWWQEKSEQKQQQYLQTHLKQLGMLQADVQYAMMLIKRIIHNATQDTRGQWILKSHQEAQSEFAITALIETKVENLIIDRTFIDENGIRWIIDYKTTTFSDADLADFLAKEQKKYLEKMRKYHEAIKLFDNRIIRLGLYFPALPAWKEWEM